MALWIYLAGLAQFAAVAVGFSALLALTRPPGHGSFEEQAHYVAESLGPVLGDPVALGAELARVQHRLRHRARVIDPDGMLLASTAPRDAPRCLRPGEFALGEELLCARAPLRFPDGRTGHLEMIVRGRPGFVGWKIILTVLVVVGVSSWLLARSLTRPLGRLSAAARAFGGGDLAARARLQRSDELGEVARTFDEMADRVTELLHAEKELLASISHELRTPLARIRVALDIAAEGDAADARESLADIGGDLDELERLISDVLTAARLDLGRGAAPGTAPSAAPPLRRERLDASELLAQAASRFRAAHPERPLHVDLPQGLPALDGDPVLLRRVIDNLLENAHKYTEQPEAPISLVARGGARIEIEVIDQGIGISPEDLAQVFRPFFRADRSRTRATGGLGLGLALARRIVEAHGGEIALHSTLQRGTRALVSLPALPHEKAA
jgi:signal transduction histidine kinase